MSNDLWRWADPDGQQRKVRLDELRAALAGGLIPPNTPVWRSGWRNWQPAQDVPELTSAADGGANGVVLNIPPPPLAMLAVQHEYEEKSGSLAPAPPPTTGAHAEEEPPPPPAFVPLPIKATVNVGPLKTQLGGSAHVPTAPGSGPAATFQPAGPTLGGPGGGGGGGGGGRLGPSLPTTIGVPPPPEVLAMANANQQSPHGGTRPMKSAPPPPPARPRPPGAPPSSGEMIEELSGSMLLDSPSAQEVGSRPSNGAMGMGSAGAAGHPAPTDPIVREGARDSAFGEDEPAGLPRRPGLSLIFDDIAEMRKGRPPKNKLLIGVLGVVALMVVIMLVAGIVSLASGPSASDKEKLAAGSASARGSASAPSMTSAALTTTATPAAASIPPPEEPKPSGPSFGDCTTTGESKSIAPRAVIQSGIEAHAVAGGLAIGFAPSARDAIATSLDPSSLTAISTARTKPIGGDARRVTPLIIGGKLAALPDVDRKGDRLTGRRIVAASTLIDVGAADGNIVWAPHGKDSFAKLFAIEGDAGVEALRAVARTDKKGIGVTFRRGNAIHVGAAKGDSVLEADGELSKIAGLGQVGSPSIAVSGDRLIVAWADRTGPQDEWKVRWTKMKLGANAEEATPFALPEGGLGGQAMSPSVASLGGGRFLLAWTEGPVSNHQVRAITIGADGSPSGSPLAISGPGVNAGQPAAVVGADGRGAVAFLAAKGKALEVHATPINCPSR